MVPSEAHAAPRLPASLLSIALHDVAPATLPQCRRVLAALHEVAPLRATLLVVPRYHGEVPGGDFAHWLNDAHAAGHELALHGWSHRDPGRPEGWLDHARRRWYTAGEGEFAALSQAEAAARLRAGCEWFAVRGWPLHGFVAPAWLMSPGTLAALYRTRLRYAATWGALVDLQAPPGAPAPVFSPGAPATALASRSLVYSTRAAWRRALSVPWNALQALSQQQRPLWRLELHPADADHPAVLRAWRRLLEQALAKRRPVTLHGAVQRLAGPDRGLSDWRAPALPPACRDAAHPRRADPR